MSRTKLTSRDLGLLYDCYKNCLLTFPQIRERHFTGKAKSTIHNRLTQLKKSGYLKAFQIGAVLHLSSWKNIGAVYCVTKTTLESLNQAFPNRTLRESPVALNTATLSHDILLTDILKILSKRYPEWIFHNGKIYRFKTDDTIIPDAVALDSDGQITAAVELELSSKSERRYRELIQEYRWANHYPQVIYVVGNDAIRKKIHDLAVDDNQDLGKFSFVNLKSLFTEENEVRK